MRTVVIVLALLVGCKEKQEEKIREVGNSVKEKAVDVAGNAKDKLGQATDKLGQATDKAVDMATSVAQKALVLGTAAKAELDKVYKSNHDYDIAVDDIDSKDAAAHAARLEKMPSVEVKGVRVGYEEDNQLSLRGTTYMKHFRASWKRGDKIVRVSFYTKETLDVVAFVALLEKIVPAVNSVL